MSITTPSGDGLFTKNTKIPKRDRAQTGYGIPCKAQPYIKSKRNKTMKIDFCFLKFDFCFLIFEIRFLLFSAFLCWNIATKEQSPRALSVHPPTDSSTCTLLATYTELHNFKLPATNLTWKSAAQSTDSHSR